MPAAPASLPARFRRPRWPIAIAAAILFAGAARGVALAPGDILVTDASASKLYVIHLDPVTRLPTGPPTELASAGFLSVPIGVGVRADGFAFLTDIGSQLVVRIDPTADSPTPVQVAISALANARGIVLDPSGDAFVSVPAIGTPPIPDFILRIDTVTGTGGPVSDSGLLQFPTGLVREPSGDLVVADSGTGGSRILRIDPSSGAQTQLAGDPPPPLPAAGAPFQVLRDIEIDPVPAETGSFLVIDSGARKVFRVDATSPYDPAHPNVNVTEWAACPQFLSPRGIAVEADHSVLVSDFSAKQVFRIHTTDPTRPITDCSPVVTASPLLGPWDVAVVGDLTPFVPGPLLVADAGTADLVQRVDPAAGTSAPVPASLGFLDPVAAIRDLNDDPLNGDIFVLEYDRIYRVTLGGVQTFVSTFAEPVDLTGIIVDADGEILVTDAANDRLVRVIPGTCEPTCQPIVVADDDATPPALLGDPAGLALDRNGTVLVANRGRPLDDPPIPTGIVRVHPISGATTVVTNDPQFGNLVAIAVDTNGDYLIADEGTDIVWRYLSSPAAIPLYPVSIGNQIEELRGIAVDVLDLNRSILVSNQGAAKILRIDPSSGVQSAVAPLVAFADIQGIALDQIPSPPIFDSDGDGVADVHDNCAIVANADQIDTNQDGFGNLCDADFDGNGSVGLTDFGAFRAKFGLGTGDPGYDPEFDLDSNGVVGLTDFGLFRNGFGNPPGPSGLACAGSTPCP